MVTINTYDGEITCNDFGFGVLMSGKYTPAEIFDVAAKNKPKGTTDIHPSVPDMDWYRNRLWVPWSRLHRNIGESILLRCRMHSPQTQTHDTLSKYIGIGDYRDVWHRYIAPESRLEALTRTLGTLRNMHVLDIGAGTGALMLYLAAYGCDVYGIESHPEMYNQRSQLVRDRIMFGDALELVISGLLPGTFDCALITIADSIWWHDFSDFIINVAKAVRVRGTIVLDTKTNKIKDRNMYVTAFAETGCALKVKYPDMLVFSKTSNARM